MMNFIVQSTPRVHVYDSSVVMTTGDAQALELYVVTMMLRLYTSFLIVVDLGIIKGALIEVINSKTIL